MKPDSILIPVDFSKCSHNALRYGLELAQTFGASAHLLHVSEEMIFYSPMFGGFQPTQEQYATYAETGLANAATIQSAEGVDITTEHRFGKPYTEILECAKQRKSSMIVMGTLGRTALRLLLLGNVAENVVRHATCPVLTIHGELDHKNN